MSLSAKPPTTASIPAKSAVTDASVPAKPSSVVDVRVTTRCVESAERFRVSEPASPSTRPTTCENASWKMKVSSPSPPSRPFARVPVTSKASSALPPWSSSNAENVRTRPKLSMYRLLPSSSQVESTSRPCRESVIARLPMTSSIPKKPPVTTVELPSKPSTVLAVTATA